MVRNSAEFGERLKRRRQALGYDSQQDLADALTALRSSGRKVSRDTVSKWETGEHYPTRFIGLIERLLGPLDDEPPRHRIPPATRRILAAALPDGDDYERVIDLLEGRGGGDRPPPGKEQAG